MELQKLNLSMFQKSIRRPRKRCQQWNLAHVEGFKVDSKIEVDYYSRLL